MQRSTQALWQCCARGRLAALAEPADRSRTTRQRKGVAPAAPLALPLMAGPQAALNWKSWRPWAGLALLAWAGLLQVSAAAATATAAACCPAIALVSCLDCKSIPALPPSPPSPVGHVPA